MVRRAWMAFVVLALATVSAAASWTEPARPTAVAAPAGLRRIYFPLFLIQSGRPSPSPTPTATATSTPFSSATPTGAPSATATSKPTATFTPTATATPTATRTSTRTATPTRTATATATHTRSPTPTAAPDCGLPFQDEFDGLALGPCWMWVRENAANWSLTTRPGYLRIVTQRGQLDDQASTARNLLLLRQAPGDFDLRVRMEFVPQPGAEGGLLAYQDDAHYVKFTIQRRSEASMMMLVSRDGASYTTVPAGPAISASLRLVRAGDTYRAYMIMGGESWLLAGTVSNTMSAPKAAVGAWSGDSDEASYADFDFFRLLAPE